MNHDVYDSYDRCWLLKLVPYLPHPVQSDVSDGSHNNQQRTESGLDRYLHAGTIPLFAPVEDTHQPNPISVKSATAAAAAAAVIIGRVDIIQSVFTACDCRSQTDPCAECVKWKKHGARYLNKNMLQFSLTDSKRCFIHSCGKNVLPTIFINGAMLSSLSQKDDGAVELHNNDQLQFVVPCLDEFLQVHYLVLFQSITPPQPLDDDMESCQSIEDDDDTSSILSLCHFSHSYETYQSLPTRSRPVEPKDTNTKRILLSSLSTHQLKALRDEYSITIFNESLVVAVAEPENRDNEEKQKFVQALMTLAIQSNQKHSTLATFPHLMRRITVHDTHLNPFP